MDIVKNHYVLGFAFSADRKQVVLIKKTKPEWQAGKWNGVGGKIEQGEMPATAMSREFEEETGVKIDPVFWDNYVSLRFNDAVVYVYRVFTDDIFEVRTTTEEEIQRWESSVNLFPYTIPNLKYLLPMALDELIDYTHIYHK